MFSKVIFIALFALIGISSVRAKVIIQAWGPRSTVGFLKCSDLIGEKIILEDIKYLDVESPCNINASFITIINVEFPVSQHVLNINGTDVILAANKFSGTEQEHYIRGSNVLLYKNLYEGQLQAHQVVGIYIHIDGNVYDGDRQIHDIVGLQIKMTENKFRTENFAYNETALPADIFQSDSRIDDQLKEEVSYFRRRINALAAMNNEWGLDHTNNLPNGNYKRFLRNVMPRLTYDPRPQLN